MLDTGNKKLSGSYYEKKTKELPRENRDLSKDPKKHTTVM